MKQKSTIMRIKPDVLKNIRKAIEGTTDSERINELWRTSPYRLEHWLKQPVKKKGR